jgi:ABC-2 type transport system ATP-binding protein
MSAISIKELSVTRGKVHALQGVSFEIEPGTITGLIGPSGSGKTTLMRTLIGAQAFQHGEVTILGKPAGSALLRKKIGYVTQSPAVYHDLSVHQNLQYFASIVGAQKNQIKSILERLDLTRQQKQLTSDLSGGQLARTSLAIALLGDPQVLILDEPTVGQDPILRDELWKLFHELAAQGKTLLVSSHIMNEAVHCDRLIMLRAGELVADTTAPELQKSTGTRDLDDAFLALVRKEAVK